MAFKSFNEIRKSRGNGISNLLKEVEKLSSGGGGNNNDDDRFWQPEVDKLGNGYAVIRFLPASADNDYPFVRVFSHSFKNETNGKWYIENCPTTIGRDDCPLCRSNNELWNTNVKENQDIVRQRKRHLHYVANVLIVKDSKNPENEGQVKLFKFGKKIFDKIKDAMQPKFEDETPIDPFDFWEGANFNLKICKVEGYRNYDRSGFDTPSPVLDDDVEIEALWKKQHDLREFIDAAKFKDAATLQKRLDQVLGNGPRIPTAQEQAEADLDAYIPPAPPARKDEAPSAPQRDVPARKPSPPKMDDDDEAAYFESLLND